MNFSNRNTRGQRGRSFTEIFRGKSRLQSRGGYYQPTHNFNRVRRQRPTSLIVTRNFNFYETTVRPRG